jgi:N-acetylglucosamine malate deacetylase 1
MHGPSQPTLAPIGLYPFIFVIVNRLASQAPPVNLSRSFGDIRMEFVVITAEQAAKPPAEIRDPSAACRKIVHVTIEHCDAERSPFDEQPQLGLVGLKGFYCAGDIRIGFLSHDIYFHAIGVAALGEEEIAAPAGILRMAILDVVLLPIFAASVFVLYIKGIGGHMKLDVLAIGAHPDDIELACAATVAKLVRAGRNVGILDLTDGELGTRGSRAIRKREAKESAEILGIKFRSRLGLPDGNIEINRTNILKVIEVLRTFQPTVILFPHSLERHPDHEHAHRLCREAWFLSGLEKIPTRVGGKLQEPFRPRKYFHYMQKYEFTPSFIVDVSNSYEVKKSAVAAFKSQFHNPKSKERETRLSSKLFLQSLEARDRHYGSLIDVEYGEPFYSIEPLEVNSLFELKL